MNITDYIPAGKQNAISRRDLCAATGLDDRTVREYIAEARRSAPILSSESGGYYTPTETESDSVALWLRTEGARARSVYRGMKGAKAWLKSRGIGGA